MPFALLLGSLLARQALRGRTGGGLFGGAGGRGGLFGGLRGLFGPRGTDTRTLDPGAWGGRSLIGRGLGSPEVYGHTVTGRDATPAFTMPGPGGGTVAIPELARAAEAGDPFAAGAIERQGQSAERMALIDELLELMRSQGAVGPTDEG